MKYIKLPPANAYKYPNAGYSRGESKNFYKELKANPEQYRNLKIRLLKQQDFRCIYCNCDMHGRTANLEHIVPLKKGGNNQSRNLAISCADCNRSKGNKMLSKQNRKDVMLRKKQLAKQSKKHARKYARHVNYQEVLDQEVGYRLRTMFGEQYFTSKNRYKTT